MHVVAKGSPVFDLYPRRLHVVRVRAEDMPWTASCLESDRVPVDSAKARANENYQRAQCLQGLHKLKPRPQDIVLVLDPDELPSQEQLRSVAVRVQNACGRSKYGNSTLGFTLNTPCDCERTFWPIKNLICFTVCVCVFYYDLACPISKWTACYAAPWQCIYHTIIIDGENALNDRGHGVEWASKLRG